MEIWLMPFAMFGIGVLAMFLALTLCNEYRRAFMANPMAIMTLEPRVEPRQGRICSSLIHGVTCLYDKG